MIAARAQHSATLLADGRVLILNRDGAASAELYDPGAGGFVPTGSTSVSRSYFSVELLPNGKVLVIGGVTGSVRLATTEVYDPSIGTFSAGPVMLSPRMRHASSVLTNGGVLIRGGYSVGAAGGTDWEFLPY